MREIFIRRGLAFTVLRKVYYALTDPLSMPTVMRLRYLNFTTTRWDEVEVVIKDLSLGHRVKVDAYVQHRIEQLKSGLSVTALSEDPIRLIGNTVINGNGRVTAALAAGLGELKIRALRRAL